MTVQTYALQQARIGKFKGKILKRAILREIFARGGRQEQLPCNNSDTYVARRWLPYGATSTDANSTNRFVQPGAGDRTAAVVQAHLTSEGVTPNPDSITPQDITVVMQRSTAACTASPTRRTSSTRTTSRRRWPNRWPTAWSW